MMHSVTKKGGEMKRIDIDRISALPDCIVEHILSFLPTLEAVRTALISKKFRYSWTWVSALHFKEEIYGLNGRIGWNVFEGKKFRNLVCQVLLLHNRPQIDRLRLECFVDCLDGMLRFEVANWLLFLLTTKQLKHCDLTFGKPNGGTCGIVPQCVFTSHSLVELRLSRCTVEVNQPIQLASLKFMSLWQVSIDDEDLKKIIEGCALLQEVAIGCCEKLTSIDFPTSNVQKLSIERPEARLKINGPNLRFLYLKSSLDLQIIDISSVTRASLFIPCIKNLQFKTFMEKVQHLKAVTVDNWLPTMFFQSMKANLPRIYCKSVNVVKLGKDGYRVSWVCCLLRQLSCLKELLIHEDSSPCDKSLLEWDRLMLGDREYCDYKCLKKRPKKVTIVGHTKLICIFVVQLAKIVLEKARVLEEFVIRKEEMKYQERGLMTSKDVRKVRHALSTIPLASRHAKLTLF